MKCAICAKKITISTEFKCSCDDHKRYCAQCRYPDMHKCTTPIPKIVLPLVVADKLVRV